MMKKTILIVVFLFGLKNLIVAQNIKIGKQIWASQNLDVDHFRNGESIPQAKSEKEWEMANENQQPAWCYYNNDSVNVAQFGKLYNWYAVKDSRGLAPLGSHIPSEKDWDVLIEYLGGEQIASKEMKSNYGWENKGNGTNSSNFSALPGGFRGGNAIFMGVGSFGSFWIIDQASKDSARALVLYNDSINTFITTQNKRNGLSVRCLID